MKRASWATLALLLAIPCAAALEGSVVRISDGDTMTIQGPVQRHTVRLEGIDAPELAQLYGRESRDTLAAICPPGAAAKVDVTGRDRYGRTLGWVTCGAWAANILQVESGAAWAFGRHLPPDSPLLQVEREARIYRRGLWTGESPEPPWSFRAKTRK